MRMVVIPLVAFFFAATAAQKTPKISFISGPEVVTDLGQSADLVCKVENGMAYPVNWVKIRGEKKEDYDYFPLSTGKTLMIRDQRFNLSYEALNSELSITLQINRIEEIDSAIYQCQVLIGVEKMITKQVQLRVKTPVKIQENSSTDLTLVEGDKTGHGTDSQMVELTKTRISISEASLSNKCTMCSFVTCILALLTCACVL